MVLDNYSTSKFRTINLQKKLVVKINKKEYLLIKLPIYPANKKEIQELMKESKSLIQSLEESEEGNDVVTLLCPSNNINKFVGKMPFI